LILTPFWLLPLRCYRSRARETQIIYTLPRSRGEAAGAAVREAKAEGEALALVPLLAADADGRARAPRRRRAPPLTLPRARAGGLRRALHRPARDWRRVRERWVGVLHGDAWGVVRLQRLLHSGFLCILIDNLIKLEIYSDYVQAHLAPSGYLKIPTDMEGYLKGCRFLPKLNNEIPSERNATYKERFSSLENLVLIMFEDDAVLIPRETAWFGYYPDGAFNPVLPPQKTKLYTEDWIGLKTLDEAGRVKFVSVPGGHLRISRSDMKKYIVPYLKPDASSKQGIRRILSL
ncbi:unnamed protein product, partial [Urochloa humidicola]